MLKIASIKINLSNLKKLVKDVKLGKGPMEHAWFDAADVYRAFVLKRFRKFSKGGGNWKPLSPRTIAAKGSSAILIDTGLLIGSLNPGLSGKTGLEREMLSNKKGVRIQFGSGAHQPSGLTIAELASIHHLGRGVPKRPILVQPDDKTKQQIAKALEARIKFYTKHKS